MCLFRTAHNGLSGGRDWWMNHWVHNELTTAGCSRSNNKLEKTFISEKISISKLEILSKIFFNGSTKFIIWTPYSNAMLIIWYWFSDANCVVWRVLRHEGTSYQYWVWCWDATNIHYSITTLISPLPWSQIPDLNIRGGVTFF